MIGGASSLESQKRGRKISMNSKLNIPKKLKDESLEEEVIRLRFFSFKSPLNRFHSVYILA
ncbi:hypothetical protein EfmAA610_19890 [Enterococcus faecium]|nr:hypothetical protein EfmAA610_19890 [Enterococcus faecium]